MPLVLDADALNAFAGEPDRLMGRDGVDVIITPHPGEMARLLNVPTEAVQANRVAHAREFATAHRVHVVLKGHRTVIAGPDGRTFVNLTGNAGMATGGTGDLLTGMIAAWFAQLLDAEAACKLAVYLHGTAGDLAEADEGEVALIASDIAARLGDAVLELTARKRTRTPTYRAGPERAARRGRRTRRRAHTETRGHGDPRRNYRDDDRLAPRAARRVRDPTGSRATSTARLANPVGSLTQRPPSAGARAGCFRVFHRPSVPPRSV